MTIILLLSLLWLKDEGMKFAIVIVLIIMSISSTEATQLSERQLAMATCDKARLAMIANKELRARFQAELREVSTPSEYIQVLHSYGISDRCRELDNY